MNVRADLLALTGDALATLASRGLLKRAVKELDTGHGPALGTGPDGAVVARFAGGGECVLPRAGLGTARCTCGAEDVCRHKLAAILAYQRQTGAEPGADVSSPGDITDDTLADVLGRRVLAAARRTHRAGYSARLRRATADDPVAVAELPSCTVRFLVPGELGYAHTDAAAAKRGESLALAVWAFREADARDLVGGILDVGGQAAASRAGLGEVLRLAGSLLLDGITHSSPVLGTALRQARRDLAERGLHWPAAAAGDLAEQLDAYHAKGAVHRPERCAELIAELHARQRASGPPSQVLGTGEDGETPLRRIRLTSLGCRVSGTSTDRTAEVFFADGTSVLMLRHRWAIPADRSPCGHELAHRRLSGTTLGRLTTSNVVADTATRSAGRILRLPAGRATKNSVLPLGSAWDDLPDTVLVRDLVAAGEELEDLPPKLVRPRIAAEYVRVVPIAEVGELGYFPGEQRLHAVVRTPARHVVRISAGHSATCPARLDALAAALRHDPRAVSGELRRVHGSLVIDPLAVLTGHGLIVPDLVPPLDGVPLGHGEATAGADPIRSAVDEALSACAELAQRGLRGPRPGSLDRIARAADGLRRAGLHATADQVSALAASPTVPVWLDTQFRLLTMAELC